MPRRFHPLVDSGFQQVQGQRPRRHHHRGHGLRRSAPSLARTFGTPLVWVIGPAGVLGCVYLFTSLSAKTMIFFAV